MQCCGYFENTNATVCNFGLNACLIVWMTICICWVNGLCYGLLVYGLLGAWNVMLNNMHWMVVSISDVHVNAGWPSEVQCLLCLEHGPYYQDLECICHGWNMKKHSCLQVKKWSYKWGCQHEESKWKPGLGMN